MLVAASVITSLAIGEVAVRWLDPLGISSLEELSKYHSTLRRKTHLDKSDLK